MNADEIVALKLKTAELMVDLMIERDQSREILRQCCAAAAYYAAIDRPWEHGDKLVERIEQNTADAMMWRDSQG